MYFNDNKTENPSKDVLDKSETYAKVQNYAKCKLGGALKKNIRDYLGIFPNRGGGGVDLHFQSQNLCNFTK